MSQKSKICVGGLSGLILSAWLFGPVMAQQPVDLPSQPPPAPVAAPAAAPVAAPASGTPAATQDAVPVPVPLPPLASAETQSSRAVVRLEAVERQLAEMTGRIETLEAGLDAVKAENVRLAAALDAANAEKVAAREEAARNTAATPASPAATTPSTAQTPAPTTADSGAATPAPAAAPSPASAPVTAPVSAPVSGPAAAPATMAAKTPIASSATIAPAPSPSVGLLNEARRQLLSGEYTRAETGLAKLVNDFPTAPEAVEARWLLGEARFVQAAWAPAAQSYVDYLRVAPQGPRAPEALIRLAGTFRELGDNRQRCLALSQFRLRNPRPDPTLKARADAEAARQTCPAA